MRPKSSKHYTFCAAAADAAGRGRTDADATDLSLASASFPKPPFCKVAPVTVTRSELVRKMGKGNGKQTSMCAQCTHPTPKFTFLPMFSKMEFKLRIAFQAKKKERLRLDDRSSSATVTQPGAPMPCRSGNKLKCEPGQLFAPNPNVWPRTFT